MITYIQGNVIDTEADLLVNAANGKGYMGGFIGRYVLFKGVSETIHYFDPSIERMTKNKFKKQVVKCGDVIHTDSGKLPFSKGILHAVTMKKPGQNSNISIVKDCLQNIITFCNENNIKTVALPLLGTGTGKVNEDEVTNLYETMLQPSDTLFKIVRYTKSKGEKEVEKELV